jgi:hypothetical protein
VKLNNAEGVSFFQNAQPVFSIQFLFRQSQFQRI